MLIYQGKVLTQILQGQMQGSLSLTAVLCYVAKQRAGALPCGAHLPSWMY